VIPASIEHSPQLYARIGGALYLAIIVLGIYGEALVRGALVVPGDPGATVNAIAGSESLWRTGIAGDLMMQVLDLPVIVVLYLLLRPVSHSLALLATGLNLVQTAVLVANKINLLTPVLLLDSAAVTSAFSPDQVAALSSVAVQAHGHGFALGLIFFGFACLVRGYLIYTSGLLPRVLGVLLFVAGLSYLLNSFALLLTPALASAMFPAVLAPALIGELSLALWLTIKGVNVPRWEEMQSGQSGARADRRVSR
jgi:hypothetical protein